MRDRSVSEVCRYEEVAKMPSRERSKSDLVNVQRAHSATPLCSSCGCSSHRESHTSRASSTDPAQPMLSAQSTLHALSVRQPLTGVQHGAVHQNAAYDDNCVVACNQKRTPDRMCTLSNVTVRATLWRGDDGSTQGVIEVLAQCDGRTCTGTSGTWKDRPTEVARDSMVYLINKLFASDSENSHESDRKRNPIVTYDIMWANGICWGGDASYDPVRDGEIYLSAVEKIHVRMDNKTVENILMLFQIKAYASLRSMCDDVERAPTERIRADNGATKFSAYISCRSLTLGPF